MSTEKIEIVEPEILKDIDKVSDELDVKLSTESERSEGTKRLKMDLNIVSKVIQTKK